MKKTKKLARILGYEKRYENMFELHQNNIILDSIQVFTCRDDRIDEKVGFEILKPLNAPLKIVVQEWGDEISSVFVTYDYLKNVTTLSIDKDDYGDKIESDGTYVFSLKENTHILKEFIK